MAVLELRAELSKVQMKKDNSELSSNALSAIKSKYDGAGVLVNQTGLVTALIAAV